MTIEEVIKTNTDTFIQDIKNMHDKNGEIFSDRDEHILRVGISLGINLVAKAIYESNLDVTKLSSIKEEDNK